jgi:hypothetical protein
MRPGFPGCQVSVDRRQRTGESAAAPPDGAEKEPAIGDGSQFGRNGRGLSVIYYSHAKSQSV